LLKKRKNKSAQMKLSFGMIFSIILIIAFLAVGFYAIKAFLNFKDDTLIVDFKLDLERDVDTAWRGNQYDKVHEYILPSKVDEVCLVREEPNLEMGEEFERYYTDDGNLYFFPLDKNAKFQGAKIDHVTKSFGMAGSLENRCFENENNRIKIRIKKDYGSNVVTLLNSNE